MRTVHYGCLYSESLGFSKIGAWELSAAPPIDHKVKSPCFVCLDYQYKGKTTNVHVPLFQRIKTIVKASFEILFCHIHFKITADDDLKDALNFRKSQLFENINDAKVSKIIYYHFERCPLATGKEVFS